jgi:tetratricopeptide (TPR) repeat protein
MAICRELRALWDIEPARVADEAIDAYRWIENTDQLGVFDERDYFLGDLALIAGTACRHLGRLDEAEVWLDRADAAFSHTVHPAPNLANVRYARLALHLARARYLHVVDLAPALLDTFERLSMAREALKCGLVHGLALKCLGRRAEGLQVFERLAASAEAQGDRDLEALVKLHFGELLLAEGRTREAARTLKAGSKLVNSSRPSLQLAFLQAVLGEALQVEGHHEEAAIAFRASAITYRELSMPGWEAYIRLALAENLLATGDHRQAEWEVLAAIPAIQSQNLEPHAQVAVALLAKSVQARNTDSRALSEVRSYLKAAG